MRRDAVFRDAGAGPYHAVLLGPAPHFIVAATAAALSERLLEGVTLPLLRFARPVASNLAAGTLRARRARQRIRLLDRGVKNLAQVVGAQNLPVAVLDWGDYNGLQVESRYCHLHCRSGAAVNVL
jgi:hypothetical protein